MKKQIYKLQGHLDVFNAVFTKDDIIEFWQQGEQCLFEHDGILYTYKGGEFNLPEVTAVCRWDANVYDVYIVGSSVIFKTKSNSVTTLPTCLVPSYNIQAYVVSDLDLDGLADWGTTSSRLTTSNGLEQSCAFAS